MPKVKILNHGRDVIHFELPILDERGKVKRAANRSRLSEKFVIGSQDDRLEVGAVKPEITLDAETWARLKGQKAISGMVADGTLSEYPLG